MSKAPIEQLLNKRGVTVERIADLVYALAQPFHDRLRFEHCIESVRVLLDKREVQQTLFTGIALDEMAERRLLPQSLQAMLEADKPPGEVGETLALGIVRLYGARSLAGFEHLHSEQISMAGVRNGATDKACEGDCEPIHIFLDDLVAGLAAAAAARISCGKREAADGEEASPHP
jgi:phosphatidylglycerophosphatase A